MMSTNDGNNLHMDRTSTPDNATLASTTSDDHSIAAYQHMRENNLNASGNPCHKKMKIDSIGSENISMMGNLSMDSGCMMSGDQMSGANLSTKAGTIPKSMPEISSNSEENIPDQMSANRAGLLPGIQRLPANVSHVLKHQDAARQLPYDGQTPPWPSQRYTSVSASLPQQQQVQQASSDRELNVNMMQMNNECVRYHNDQDEMMQLQQPTINIMCDPVGFQMKKSRCNMTAMQPSNYPIEQIRVNGSTISHDNVQSGSLALWQPWSPTHCVPNVMAAPTPQLMSLHYQLEKSAYVSSNSQANPTPRTSTAILDLDDDCLIEICRKLDEYDLYRLRESHNRFAFATEYCYNKMDSEKSLEFDLGCWSDLGIGGLVKILDYFGDCMTRVRIDKFFVHSVIEQSISQSFLAERLKNVRFLRLYYAGHHELDFLSALEHIQEFELKGFYDWMPLHVRWSHLNQLNVVMESPWSSQFQAWMNGRAIGPIIDFLKMHKGIQKLSIDVVNDGWKLSETIATQSELIELDLGSTLFTEVEFFQSLSKLRKLTFDSTATLRWFERFKNLKHLHMTSRVELEKVCEILERIPSLTNFEIAAVGMEFLEWDHDLDDPEMDNIILGPMIEKRKLSAKCECELIHIYIAFLRLRRGKFKYYPKSVKRCDKYVKIYEWKVGRELYEGKVLF